VGRPWWPGTAPDAPRRPRSRPDRDPPANWHQPEARERDVRRGSGDAAGQVVELGSNVEEILQHADKLAARFESYEPSPADELDADAVALLRAAVAERSQAERHLIEAVQKARDVGLPWSAIGSFLGTIGEAARQRYATKVA